MIGKKLGNYRILEQVGVGGVGHVYKATDLLLQRTVAIKALRADLASRPDVLERFRSEARTLARLNHPRIATLYSLLEHARALFMVMEFVEGRTLASVLKERRRLALREALPIFFQALDGIGYAHEHGIVHRDVKGSNLMLNDRGDVKVMDFGIARALGSDRVTRIGHMVGTLRYMSPEQIRGEETDARSDIYSLGVLLFDMLTGRVPFARRSDYELMRAHVELPPPSPRQIVQDIPDAVERAILRALAKDPVERFATTAELRSALEEVDLEALPLTVALPAPSQAEPTRVVAEGGFEPEDPTLDEESEAPTHAADAPPVKRGRRRAWLWAGAVAASVALVLGVGLNVLRVAPADPGVESAPKAPPRAAPPAPPELVAGGGEVAPVDAAEVAALEALGLLAVEAPEPEPKPAVVEKKPRAAPAAARAPRRPRPAVAARRRPPAPRESKPEGQGWVIRR